MLDAATRTAIATVPTGEGPHEVVASPDGRIAVVSNYGNGQVIGSSLTVIDLATHAVRATISLGEYRRPHGMAFLPDPRFLAVTSERNQAVVIVDLDSAKVAGAIPTTQQGSHMLAVRKDGRVGYTANVGSGSITEIDLAARATGRVLPVATNTEGIGVTPDGAEVWVASRDQNKVFVVNTRAWKVTDTLDAQGLPYRVGVTPNGKIALVTNPSANIVRLFDVAAKKELAAIAMPAGSQPVGIAVSADGATAYISCQGNNTVQIIDVARRQLVGSMPAGAKPDGIAVAHRG
jgi:YVTN family beta-propeller protein